MNYSDKELDRNSMNALMRWFEVHRRTMPWRGESDPYKIWVSEVMLQQTQVIAVIPYYHRWMNRFPTLQSLAEADIDSILELWQGLGYYSRPRHLLAGARYLCEHHKGRFPRTRLEALEIPGVGEYIAGAVLSIAYNLPEPAIDGNVIRVITRIFEIADASTGKLKKAIGSIVARSYWDFDPRWVNQAWMEMGALQCTMRPACEPCPFGTVCRAFSSGTVAGYPVVKKKKPAPLRRGMIFLIRQDDRILMVKRPASGLLANLWEFPNILEHDQNPVEFLRIHNLRILDQSAGTVKHAYSHFKVSFEVRNAELTADWKSDRWVEHRWMSQSDLDSVGKPMIHIKAMKLSGF